MGDRVILHVDMDAFFASVEVLDRPELKGRPVIVGGDGDRGVVAACTYEARRFGVHSAMSSTLAKRLCPDAVFLPGRFSRYVEESQKLHAIFRDVTPLVEGIALDEAFLDVSGSRELGDGGLALAQRIRQRVADELHLACSVGIGRSKLMAKLASKEAKPRADRVGIAAGAGIVRVEADLELEFLHPLPVRALWGVGPVTNKRLEEMGVRTVGDLTRLPAGTLERRLGTSLGRHLQALARGEDSRPVVPDQEAKSIGHEETFARDLWDPEDLAARLTRMVDASASHLRRAGRGARTVSIKVKFSDFSQLSRSHSLTEPIDATPALGAVAQALLASVDINRGVRLLGVSFSGFADEPQGRQLAFSWGEEPVGGEPVRGAGSEPLPSLAMVEQEAVRLQSSWGAVTGAVDEIRARYGGSAVGAAALMGPRGLQPRRRGEAQWGPSGTDDGGQSSPGGKSGGDDGGGA